MRPFDALQQVVKKDLTDAFGFGLASLIVVEARKTVGIQTSQISEGEYTNIINTILKDNRVTDMWGVAGAADKLSKWKDAPKS